MKKNFWIVVVVVAICLSYIVGYHSGQNVSSDSNIFKVPTNVVYQKRGITISFEKDNGEDFSVPEDAFFPDSNLSKLKWYVNTIYVDGTSDSIPVFITKEPIMDCNKSHPRVLDDTSNLERK